jgi:hypothetical protein
MERVTALTVNTWVELIAMREMLSAAQTIVEGCLNALFHALLPSYGQR